MSVRVLIVDDHDGFRTGLRLILERDGFEVAEAASGDAALRYVLRLRPHVVVMDVNMPQMSGIEATRRVLDMVPGTAVVMLSMFDDEDMVAGALRAGASRYLRKDARFDVIVTAIRAAADDPSPIHPLPAPGAVGSGTTRPPALQ